MRGGLILAHVTNSGPILSPAAILLQQVKDGKLDYLSFVMITDVDGLIINRLSSKNLNVVCFGRLFSWSKGSTATLVFGECQH